MLQTPMHKPTIIAHRGFSAAAPENTIPAFLSAIDAGADMIEFDVRLTADNRLVIIHDATLDRTTTGHGAVSHQTLSELRRLDAGAWFGSAFAGSVIPTLDDVLELCHGRGVLANIEVKTEERRVAPLDQLADVVAASVSELGATDSVVISSYSRRVVSRLSDTDRRLATALLTDRLFTNRHVTVVAQQVGAIALHVPYRLATSQLADRARQRGLISAVHTVNDPTDMTRAVNMGFDAIFTDRPDRLRRLVDLTVRLGGSARPNRLLGAA